MTELEQIEQKISQKKSKLENVEGTKTEVWTRIVGYYRPVSQWNSGKAAELKERLNYKVV